MSTSLPVALSAHTMNDMPTAAPAAPPAGLADSLARLARSRDERAWALLVARAAAELHRLAARILGSAAAADDAIQEVFLQVRDGADRFRPASEDADADAMRWLRRITVHVCCRQLRTDRRRARRQALALDAQGQTRGGGASDRLIAQEQATLLRRALGELPARVRDAIVLHHLGGGTFQDIAREFGCPVGTIKARVSRGLEAMRLSLARSGVALSVAAVSDSLTALPAPAPAHAGMAGAAHLVQPLLTSARAAASPLGGSIAFTLWAASAATGAAAALTLALMFHHGRTAPMQTPSPPASPPLAAAGTGAVPSLTPLPEGVGVAEVVPDLRTGMERLQALALAIDPAGQNVCVTLRAGLAGSLGPDALAAGSLGPCVLTMPVAGGTQDWVTMMSAHDPARIAGCARASGAASRVDGDLVQIASAEAALLPPAQAQAEYASLKDQSIEGEARLLISPARLLTARGASARAAVAAYLPLAGFAMARQLGIDPLKTTKAALLAFDVALAAASEIETCAVDMRMDLHALTLTCDLTAVRGSRLAGALQGSEDEDALQQEMRRRLGPDAGVLAFAGHCPFPASLRYLAALIAAVPDQSERDALPDSLRDTALSYYSRFDGPEAAALREGPDGGLLASTAIAVADTHALLLDAQGLWNSIITESAIPAILTSRHMKVEYLPLSQRIRAQDGSEAPVDVIRQAVLPGLPAEQAKALQATISAPTYEAYLPRCLLSAQDLGTLQAMAQDGGSPLVLPPACSCWPRQDGALSCDLPRLIALQTQISQRAAAAMQGRVLPREEIQSISTPPTILAWRADAGSAQVRAVLPVASLTALIALGRQYGIAVQGAASTNLAAPAEPPVAKPSHEF